MFFYYSPAHSRWREEPASSLPTLRVCAGFSSLLLFSASPRWFFRAIGSSPFLLPLHVLLEQARISDAKPFAMYMHAIPP